MEVAYHALIDAAVEEELGLGQKGRGGVGFLPA